MKLAYRAFDKTGREVVDVIDAPGLAEATEQLHRKDLFVADITPTDAPEQASSVEGRPPRGRSKRLRLLAMFTRQLFVLVRTGTPLAAGLGALQRQSRNPAWQGVIADVRKRLEQGVPLSTAMEAHPACFDTVYRNMIFAGESSGKLPTVLDRLASLTRKRLHIRNTLRAAMTYPALLIFVSLGVMVSMMFAVIPRFAELFEALDVPLPPSTAAIVSLSEWLQSFWWVVVVALIAGGIGASRYLRTPAGRRWLDTVLLKIPMIGSQIRSFTTAKIARLLGVLLDSHLDILEALRLTRGAVTNCHYVKLIDRAEKAVVSGETISSAFEDTDLISPSVYEALRSGEQSGQVSALLLDMADFMDEENETRLKSLTTLIEPVILIVMGVVVAFVALSIFMPLFDLGSMTGTGGSR